MTTRRTTLDPAMTPFRLSVLSRRALLAGSAALGALAGLSGEEDHDQHGGWQERPYRRRVPGASAGLQKPRRNSSARLSGNHISAVTQYS
jgi:hypothetical protein